MKKYLALVKLLFVQQYKARAVYGTKKKRAGAIALYIVLAVCFAPVVISVAVAMYYMGKISNGNVYIGTFFTLMCQGLVLMFGVHAIMSNVFIVRDADKLLYLPVRAHVIFLAKLTVAYLNELITTAVTLLVVLLPFALGAHAGAGFYLMLPIALLLIPMLPMLLGTLVAMPLSALVNAFGKNSSVKTVLRILIYAGIMALYMYLMYGFGFLTGSDGSIMDDPEGFITSVLGDFADRLENVMPYFHPDYMLIVGMLATDIGTWAKGFALSLGENLALFALVLAASLPFYRSMLTLSVEDGASRRKKTGKEQYKLHNYGAVKEFMLNDFRRTIRDAQTGFQSFAGIIMMPLIVVLMYFMLGLTSEGDSSFLDLMRVSDLYQVIAPLVILVYMSFIGVGTNVLGLYPVSRENRAVYILKSLPVPFDKILLSKVLLATAVMSASNLVTCVLIVALFGVKWYYGIAMLAVMLLVGFGAMCVTTVLDLKEPRIGWENFNSGLKNAKNSWIAMLISLLSGVALALASVPFILLYALFDGWYFVLLMWLFDLALGVAFAAVAYKVMTSKSAKYFERIEV